MFIILVHNNSFYKNPFEDTKDIKEARVFNSYKKAASTLKDYVGTDIGEIVKIDGEIS